MVLAMPMLLLPSALSLISRAACSRAEICYDGSLLLLSVAAWFTDIESERV